MLAILPATFGILIGFYGYILSGKLRNLFLGLLALPWGFLMVGPFLGYFLLYDITKKELNIINKIS